jgi:hypothetical protein
MSRVSRLKPRSGGADIEVQSHFEKQGQRKP